MRIRSLIPIGVLLVAGCALSGAQPESRDERGYAAVAGNDGSVGLPAEVQTRFEQATAVMAAGDFVEAELRFKEFMLLYPAFPGAHVNLAIIYANNDDATAARTAVNAALAIDPEFAPGLNQLGLLLRRSGKFLEAEAAYMKAVTVSPEYALAHYNLGILNELYMQRLEMALQNFERYQELVGNDKQVEKWIADLKRRVAANQRSANVAK